ncbi:UNVERIFIED_CONTAM: Histone deacetylase hda1, partial [Siphonaria sp. JEL0065]
MTREFKPDIIVVSAGFDAGVGELGGCFVTPAGFGRMTRALMDPTLPSRGKLVLALEGGTVLDKMSECVASCVRALLHDKIPKKGTGISEIAVTTIAKVMSIQRRYWLCIEDAASQGKLGTVMSATELNEQVSNISNSPDYGFEILRSPIRDSALEVAVAHVLILDAPFYAAETRCIIDGAVPYVDKMSIENTPFLILEFNTEFPNSASDSIFDGIVSKLWQVAST